MQVYRNRYFVQRHGHSEANALAIIASDPDVATRKFGLTPQGRAQVRSALHSSQAELSNVHTIITSGFLRAAETARLAAEVLGAKVEICELLRERFFGDWDGRSNEHYRRVWAEDAKNPAHESWNVESVQAVAGRMLQAVGDLESGHRGRTFLLVSHGDPLQVLLTACSGQDVRDHRELDPLKTAEIRQLVGQRR